MTTNEKRTVLVLGETQSGKSTLVEAFKLYANPTYVVDSSKIGGGNVSLTTHVREELIVTRVPHYEVSLKSATMQRYAGRKAVNIDSLISQGKEDYEDSLDNRKLYDQPVPRHHRRNMDNEFTIIDTPGLNDTNDQDEAHVFKIFQALGGRSLDLVLVTVPQGPLSLSLQAALRSYLELFPQLGGIMGFVHTKVDYSKLHPASTDFWEAMSERVAALSNLMGRDSFPHFWIDCDFQGTKPARKCITNNILGRILWMAFKNEPVYMARANFLTKTPRMREADAIIRDQVLAIAKTIERTLEFTSKGEGTLLHQVYQKATYLNELRAQIQTYKDLKASFETDDLELLHEDYFDDFQSKIQPNEEVVLEHSGSHTFDQVSQWSETMELAASILSNGCKTFKAIYVRSNDTRNCCCHLKLYAKRCNMFKSEIEELEQMLGPLEEYLRTEEAEQHDQRFQGVLDKILTFVANHNQHTEVIRLATASTIDKDLFTELLRRRAYTGDMSEISEKVAAVYRDSARRLAMSMSQTSSASSAMMEGVSEPTHQPDQYKPARNGTETNSVLPAAPVQYDVDLLQVTVAEAKEYSESKSPSPMPMVYNGVIPQPESSIKVHCVPRSQVVSVAAATSTSYTQLVHQQDPCSSTSTTPSRGSASQSVASQVYCPPPPPAVTPRTSSYYSGIKSLPAIPTNSFHSPAHPYPAPTKSIATHYSSYSPATTYQGQTMSNATHSSSHSSTHPYQGQAMRTVDGSFSRPQDSSTIAPSSALNMQNAKGVWTKSKEKWKRV